MINERPFRTSTLQDLSNDTKNAQMRGDLTPAIELWVFGSLGGLQLPTFGSVGFTLTLSPKWGCDTFFVILLYIFLIYDVFINKVLQGCINKCVVIIIMNHNYEHTFSHLSNCSIVLNVKESWGRTFEGIQKTLIANSFWGQEQQWNFHWFVFILLFLLQSSSYNFFEVDEHLNGTTKLLYLVLCNCLPIEYGCLMYICKCLNI
jgi:hypothetical protein